MKRMKPVSDVSSLGTETNAQIVKSNFADWRLRLQTTSLGSSNDRAPHFAGLDNLSAKLLL